MQIVNDFREKVKQKAMNFYSETGIKLECEECFIITDPECPDYPHICALEEGLKKEGKSREWILENLAHCIKMRNERERARRENG